MTTSERKNAKRMKKLQSIQATNPERFEVEKDQLLQAWGHEIWHRVKDRTQPPVSALIEIASRYGLRQEVAWEAIQAVACELGGPGFSSRSLALQKNASHMIGKLEGAYTSPRDRHQP